LIMPSPPDVSLKSAGAYVTSMNSRENRWKR
jgi:hypothetical protein